jgi:hypothetical protein
MTIDSIGCGAGERRRPEIVSRVVVCRGRIAVDAVAPGEAVAARTPAGGHP